MPKQVHVVTGGDLVRFHNVRRDRFHLSIDTARLSQHTWIESWVLVSGITHTTVFLRGRRGQLTEILLSLVIGLI